jgi:hypothetical protein
MRSNERHDPAGHPDRHAECPSFQAAQMAQYSAGAHTHRRAKRPCSTSRCSSPSRARTVTLWPTRPGGTLSGCPRTRPSRSARRYGSPPAAPGTPPLAARAAPPVQRAQRSCTVDVCAGQRPRSPTDQDRPGPAQGSRPAPCATTSRDVFDRGLHDTFALRTARGTNPDLDAVVLSGLRELRGDPVAPGVHTVPSTCASSANLAAK